MYDADSWPIAAKMNFGNKASDGRPLAEAPEEWEDHIEQVVELGFRHIDPIDEWLPIDELTPKQFNTLKQLLERYDLQVPAISLGRNSLVHPERGAANLEMMHRMLDRAAELGAGILNFSFAQALKPEQLAAQWFWYVKGHEDDPATRPLAVERVRELAEHAQQNDMQLSLEIYENSFVGTAETAVAFMQDVDHPAVGLNPDFGNLIRLHRPTPSYQSMFDLVLPHSNYWHIKNYLRDEDLATGAYFSAPAPLESGLIDYRTVIRQALKVGFQGAFQAEHYGGDWLTISARNAAYIRSVLRSALGARGRAA